MEIATHPFRVCFLSTHSQGINQYHLQKLDNRIIDLDAALYLYTENTHELEQCSLMEFWPKTLRLSALLSSVDSSNPRVPCLPCYLQ